MSSASNKRKQMISTGTVAVNRRARYDYAIEEEFEAGLSLTGTEVKALRHGLANLSDAYAGPKDGRIALFNLHIGEYSDAPKRYQHEAKRIRLLLLKKREHERLIGAVKKDGRTLIPMKIYFTGRGLAKLSLGLGTGKREIDKRQTIKDRDWQRKKGALLRESR